MSTKPSSTKEEKLERIISLFPEKVCNLNIISFSNHYVYFLRLGAMSMFFPCEWVFTCFSHNLYRTLSNLHGALDFGCLVDGVSFSRSFQFLKILAFDFGGRHSCESP
jgi:hypothetical protein